MHRRRTGGLENWKGGAILTPRYGLKPREEKVLIAYPHDDLHDGSTFLFQRLMTVRSPRADRQELGELRLALHGSVADRQSGGAGVSSVGTNNKNAVAITGAAVPMSVL